MRSLAKCLGIMVGAFFLVGCALSDEPTGPNGSATAQLPQGLSVLEATDSSLALAYRQGSVVIYLEAKRGKETPELYQFDSKSPLFEMDARFTDANGFIFYIQQGGHSWLDSEWGQLMDRQTSIEKPVIGSNEVLFRTASEAAKTMHADLDRLLGASKARALAPEIDAIFAYAAIAHAEYLRGYETRQQDLLERGEEQLPPLNGTTGEITYGTPGPDDPAYYMAYGADYSITLHADELDGIPGYAGGYHSATARHAWIDGVYWTHSTCNHGRCGATMTQRGASGYKTFAANLLKANHCSGEYKWDSDGGDYGHNCHDDSRIQMHNYRYGDAVAVGGHFRWCDGGDRDHDISVDVLFVELDQTGYPRYEENNNNRSYGTRGDGEANYGNWTPPSAIGIRPFSSAGTNSYSATNTSSGAQNTIDFTIDLTQGTSYEISTCSGGSGDTYLRLLDPSASLVSTNDDGCGLLSKIQYSATQSGTYIIRAGCYGSGTCSGNVTVTVTSTAAPPSSGLVCDYTMGCESYWMGVGDGCDCQADGSSCGDPDCG